MNIAIVHYHLRPGGVTRVIENASRELTDQGIRHAILSGETVPGLDYLSSPGGLTSHALLDRLRAAARDALAGEPDIWHFHNHSLGKNVLIPGVIKRLAEQNERLLLQIHDLAEDGRAENYPLISGFSHLYPISTRIRYAFINEGDMSVFREHGIDGVLLPNRCRADIEPAPVPATGPPFLFYPVRGICRKNLGELVLLTSLAGADVQFAVSRAPENPRWRPIHDAWEKFAREQRLPVEFDAARTASFESLIERATHFITTSVKEGCGLAFSEAAAYQKPIFGRRINEAKDGHLYDRILVSIDEATLRKNLAESLRENYRLYQQPMPSDAVETALSAMRHGDHFDFGNLPEALQQQAILRGGPFLIQQQDTVTPAAEWLAKAISDRAPAAPPWNPPSPSLMELYQDLLEQPASPPRFLPPDRILNFFLQPSRFHFLMSP